MTMIAANPGTATPDAADGYAHWLERLDATYEAVAYTCRVRLGDRGPAEQVALRVATGLLARPAVFRHWGLPYSGRIARLAEDAIDEVRRGARHAGSYDLLHRDLLAVPPSVRDAFVQCFVEGLDDAACAVRCGGTPARAAERRFAALDHMHALAVRHGAEPRTR